jgi:anti-sigma-K factor RskA
MTIQEPMSAEPECAVDAAAYVLGALEDDEADAFQGHLLSCAACREEVDNLSVSVDAMALAVPPQAVPRALKRRVMADVRSDAGVRSGAGVRSDAGVRSEASSPAHRRPRRVPRFTWVPALRSPVFAAGAAVVALAVVIGAIALGSGAPGPRVIQASVGWPGGAVLRISGGRGELIVRRMPAAPSGKVYEVWLQRGVRAPSPTSALFDVTSSGAGSVDVPGNLRGVSSVMVTPEPRGGSTVPTHPAVLVARL